MDKLRKVLLLVLVSLLILPFGVFAEEESEESKEESKEVTVYFFRGQGCSHCAEAEAWFKSIEEEYGSKFEIKDYETWYNEENSELMGKVAKARGEEDSATGVPYIIIGDQSWIGFDQAYEQEMIDKINALYETEVDSRYDIMKLLTDDAKDTEKKKDNDFVSLLVVLVIFGGVGTGVYFARKNSN